MPLKNHYKTLGLQNFADKKSIHDAYIKKALKTHADKGGSENSMKDLNEANAVLADEAKKLNYDINLKREIDNKKKEENIKKWEEENKKWEELKKKADEEAKKRDEERLNHLRLERLHNEAKIMEPISAAFLEGIRVLTNCPHWRFTPSDQEGTLKLEYRVERKIDPIKYSEVHILNRVIDDLAHTLDANLRTSYSALSDRTVYQYFFKSHGDFFRNIQDHRKLAYALHAAKQQLAPRLEKHRKHEQAEAELATFSTELKDQWTKALEPIFSPMLPDQPFDVSIASHDEEQKFPGNQVNIHLHNSWWYYSDRNECLYYALEKTLCIQMIEEGTHSYNNVSRKGYAVLEPYRYHPSLLQPHNKYQIIAIRVPTLTDLKNCAPNPDIFLKHFNEKTAELKAERVQAKLKLFGQSKAAETCPNDAYTAVAEPVRAQKQ